jgi:sterol desaturase/sphingolipid hydroxylase (fatty acid hydroxylase superfamily)
LDLSNLATNLLTGCGFVAGQLGRLLFSFGSHFSFSSLGAALVIATAFYAAKRIRHGRKLNARVLLRALFPKRVVNSPSNNADIGYLFFNVLVFGILFGWAILSYETVTNGIIAGLVRLFGEPAPTTLPPWASNTIVTVMLFLAYELGYWFNHWLSHRVPVLWEFHKVHHSAEVLTPLTNFRVHPVYGWIFANILALATATANGFGNYMFGKIAHQYALSDTNIILVFFIHTYVHLQHTHIWISFTGPLGRLFVSPAHHQIHHSSNPAHFNRNFGSCLAVWDWMFGTLHVPGRKREALSFGVEPDQYPAHTVTGELVAPFLRAGAQLAAMLPGRRVADVTIRDGTSSGAA